MNNNHSISLSTLLTILVLIIFSRPAFSQQDPYPDWKNFTSLQKITTFASEGKYLWIGTEDGLVKFNTNNDSTTIFLNGNSRIPGNSINALQIDKRGKKWIFTSNGLATLENDNWRKIETNKFRNRSVKTVAIDSKGKKWIGTSQGLLTYYNNQWKSYDTLEASSIQTITTTSDGAVWVGTAFLGLFRYNNGNWRVYDRKNSPLPDNDISTINLDGQGNLWMGSGWSLVKYNYDSNGWQVYKSENSGLPEFGSKISQILPDDKGNIWVALGGMGPGLMKFNGSNWRTINVRFAGGQNNFQDNVQALYKDTNDNLWIGTGEDGLISLKNSIWKAHELSSVNLLDNIVNTLVIDSSGNKWVGTIDGLSFYDNKRWKSFTNTSSVFPEKSIHTAEVVEDRLWFGFGWEGNGLAHYKNGNWRFLDTGNSDIPGQEVSDIAADDQGNKWLATNKGLAKYRNGNWEVFNKQNSGIPYNTLSGEIATDSKGNIWIVSRDLIRYNGTNWRVFNASNSQIPPGDLNCIGINDSTNNIWIGSDNGLIKYDGNKWAQFSSTNSGLPSNLINTVNVDNSGNIWIGTAEGLVSYNEMFWRVYKVSNSGLSGNWVSDIAIGSSNKKWVATGKGVSVFEGKPKYNSREKENTKQVNVSVYPNPTANELKIQVPNAIRYFQYRLFNQKGQEMKTGKFENSRTTKIQVSELAKGFYHLSIRWDKSRTIRTISVR